MLHMVLEVGKREKVLFSCFLVYIKLPWSQEHRQPFYKEEFLEREQTAPGWLSATYDPLVCLNNNNDEEKGNQGRPKEEKREEVEHMVHELTTPSSLP